MEQSFRQAYRISNHELSIFTSSTVAQVLIAITVLSIALPVIGMIRNRNKQQAQNGIICWI